MLHSNAILRWSALGAAGGFFLFGGVGVGVAALAVAFATFMLCLSFHGDRGERIWLTMTLVAWGIMAAAAMQSWTACPSDGPNHCAVGR